MSGRYLIAFGGRPQDPSTFIQKVVELMKDENVEITGAVLCPGPGCHNLAIIINHPNHERIAQQLAMALMPAKYETPCDDPKLQVGQFVTEGY